MLYSRIGMRARILASATIVALVAAGCSGQNGGMSAGGAQPALPPGHSNPGHKMTSSASILKHLTTQTVIGSTVDPANGALNPYGLTVAPSTNGVFTAGDLVVCSFNSKYNQQGSGKSIVALHPTPGSSPIHVTQNAIILGCNALALGPDDTLWTADFTGNNDGILSSTGKPLLAITGKPFSQPFGQVFAQPPTGSPAFYATNARTGTVVRINLGSNFTYDVIAKNFPRNRGVPGTILAPSGLAYDPSIDTLYFADGKNNTLVAISSVSSVPNGGIVAQNNGMSFSGPFAANARVVFAGSPLNGPISTALLPNGNIAVGNTLDPAGTNLIIEISPAGQVLDQINVDTGPGGAIFGMVATGTSTANTRLYFNDDNQNNVQVLGP